MPEIDGFSFLKNFKDLPEKIKIKSKIVVLTSSNSSKIANRLSRLKM